MWLAVLASRRPSGTPTVFIDVSIIDVLQTVFDMSWLFILELWHNTALSREDGDLQAQLSQRLQVQLYVLVIARCLSALRRRSSKRSDLDALAGSVVIGRLTQGIVMSYLQRVYPTVTSRAGTFASLRRASDHRRHTQLYGVVLSLLQYRALPDKRVGAAKTSVTCAYLRPLAATFDGGYSVNGRQQLETHPLELAVCGLSLLRGVPREHQEGD